MTILTILDVSEYRGESLQCSIKCTLIRCRNFRTIRTILQALVIEEGTLDPSSRFFPLILPCPLIIHCLLGNLIVSQLYIALNIERCFLILPGQLFSRCHTVLSVSLEACIATPKELQLHINVKNGRKGLSLS